MSSIKDTFNNLKTSIVGTNTINIDKDLDDAINSINSYKNQSGKRGYIDLINTVLAKGNDSSIPIGTSQGVYGGMPSPESFGQGQRLMRYKLYDSIVSNIPFCYRALDVLTDNILYPDDITKISLDIREQDDFKDDEKTRARVGHVKESLKKLKLEDKLSLIVKNTLLYGDFFCEISSEKESMYSSSILSEGLFERNSNDFVSIPLVDCVDEKVKREILEEDEKVLLSNIEKKSILLDFSADSDSNTEEKLENKKLLYYEPCRVIKLQSIFMPVCLGYLVFPMVAINPAIAVQNDMLNNICSSIINNLSKKIPHILKNDNFNVEEDELKLILMNMLRQTTISKVISIRYVPPNKMVHFKRPTVKYHPYGESIFDASQYTAKVIISLETALAIDRMRRSTEKLMINVEVGLPRDAANQVERLKELFKKRKISLDNFGTIDTIASYIHSYEDYIIPMKDGKKYVEIAPFSESSGGNRTSKVDEIKFLRDQLVASFGVLPAALGIEENINAKNTMSEESVMFCRTVIGHQKYFIEQVKDLVQKLYDMISPEEAAELLNNVLITLEPPKSLQYERETTYMNNVVGLMQNLQNIGIPKKYLQKRYLPFIDWDDIEKYKTEEKIEKTDNTNLRPEEVPEGMPGGYGMDMGMGGIDQSGGGMI